jgi:indolepyruvate ferredoxin oxidoreductase alpha subunit
LLSKKLLTGDEAIARGAWEAGCKVAAAYPGTPSTEILEALVKYSDVYCEWSANEKVALEVALGAALAGVRALATMKHVGLNVAADPLFSSAYIGVNAGLVIVSADDPGMHSSQNEQDNRWYGLAARIPVLTPSDSQEAKEFTKLAFQISEEFNIPVILRITTRIAHSKTVVETADRIALPSKGYTKDFTKTTLLPSNARPLHRSLEDRVRRLTEYSNTKAPNRIEEGQKSLGVIADGVAYQYAREIFPKASFLKLGMVNPFPAEIVRRFARGKKRIFVVEETDPFLELQVKALGIKAVGKDKLPLCDELSPRIVRNSLAQPGPEAARREATRREVKPVTDIPGRPPALCPGCPHAGLHYLLQRKDVIVTGDIGCYTLGACPPHNTMDSCVCMGASITLGHGVEKALDRSDKRRVVAMIGDSTFFHNGLPGLVNAVYNKGNTITIVVDNRTTGMTGHQDHPGTGKTLMGEPTKLLDIAEVVKGLGIEKVHVLDPYKIRENRAVMRRILSEPGPAVVVSRRECVLLTPRQTPKRVLPEPCNGCRLCLQLGCPAMSFIAGKVLIDDAACVGCGMCVELCAREAIV